MNLNWNGFYWVSLDGNPWVRLPKEAVKTKTKSEFMKTCDAIKKTNQKYGKVS